MDQVPSTWEVGGPSQEISVYHPVVEHFVVRFFFVLSFQKIVLRNFVYYNIVLFDALHHQSQQTAGNSLLHHGRRESTPAMFKQPLKTSFKACDKQLFIFLVRNTV